MYKQAWRDSSNHYQNNILMWVHLHGSFWSNALVLTTISANKQHLNSQLLSGLLYRLHSLVLWKGTLQWKLNSSVSIINIMHYYQKSNPGPAIPCHLSGDPKWSLLSALFINFNWKVRNHCFLLIASILVHSNLSTSLNVCLHLSTTCFAYGLHMPECLSFSEACAFNYEDVNNHAVPAGDCNVPGHSFAYGEPHANMSLLMYCVTVIISQFYSMWHQNLCYINYCVPDTLG